MADGHGEATDWEEGPYDPLLVQDDLDDVMHLLDMPAVVLDPAPLAVAQQDNLQEWPPANYLNNDSVDSRAPTHDAAVAGDRPSTSSTQYAGAGTSATAGAHDENALLDCSGCHVLREVLHSNGLEATKLCVHGNSGVFYHATLEVYRINSEGMATALTHQSYIDFRGLDYMWVKHYLTGYAQQRAGGGYTVVHDSISAFHDALSVSMNYDGDGGNADGDDHRREGMEVAAAVGNGGCGGDQDDGAVDAEQPLIEPGDVPATAGPSEPSASNDHQERREVRKVGRSAIAIQRQRASKLQLSDLARYFHLPMTQAARLLGVCATVLKTTSRRSKASTTILPS
ncbi:hypothetical protein PVAP13_3KG068700 [Panicum virgatum]|uniref:RWP-RK domain-containing protein n=1 Tax=Panicum virgatum TaxID=38727 RepID=A0A8T0ULX8_PANVG|nr:hypothetical protein PVAP13_3KG068700 [Panicum virgatum]